MKKIFYILLFFATSLSAAVTPPLRSFNAGEISPLMNARSDFPKYKSACQTLVNFFVLAQGPVSRRPGTKYIAEVKDSADATRVISFEFSKTDTYVLEIGDEYLRVYRNGGQVLDPTDPYEIVTPWDANDVFEIQFVQSANTMYLVHPDHPPQELTRTAHTTWTINDFDIETGPFLNENEDTTEDVNSTAVSGSVTLNSNFQMFDDDHVGSLWQISHQVDSNSISDKLDANESSPTIACFGDFDFSTHGSWTGYIALERSEDDGSTWNEIPEGSTYSKHDSNIEYSDSEDEIGVIYRVTMSQHDRGTCTYNLLVHSHIHNGVVKITAVTDPNTATATVLSALSSTDSTHRWSEGAWSDYRGWPETVEFHEERLIFGGSANYPQTIWFGAIADDVDDYNDFTEGVLDDDAFIYVLPGHNPIQWMLSQNYIMIGTLGGVGRYGDETEPLTPTTPEYRTQAKQQGSAYIQAVMAGDAILYVERGGTKVREFVYNLERDRFVAPDMTIIAEHITKAGIVDIAYQSRPDSILWCVLETTGDIATMTYQRDHEVIAWALQTTEGDYESVTVVPGTDEDEVWVVVNRTIDSSTVRYIEQFQPRDWGTDQTDCYFVDSGLSFDGGDAVSITAITKADPAVVTVSAWPTDGAGTNLADDDEVMITGVGGMTETNDNIYTIDDANISAKTFSLNDSANVGDVNSVGFTTYTSGGTAQRFEKNFSGLGHLEGEEVAVFTDGGPHQNLNVSSGTIQISEWSNKVLVGQPYTSKFETLPLVFDTQSGSTSSMKKRIIQVNFDFYETLGAFYGIDADNLTAIDFDTLFSGWKECGFQYGSFRKATVYIETSQPVPLTIRALEPMIEIIE